MIYPSPQREHGPWLALRARRRLQSKSISQEVEEIGDGFVKEQTNQESKRNRPQEQRHYVAAILAGWDERFARLFARQGIDGFQFRGIDRLLRSELGRVFPHF